LFLLDFLVEDESGMLVSGPSSSPENTYYLRDGTVGALCMAPSMDTQIIRETLGHCLEAARILKIENELQKRIEAALPRLPEHKIGKHGQLQEWAEDYDEPDPGHRHISHLFALHPRHADLTTAHA
jgi:alpha-L-fucosidase 2